MVKARGYTKEKALKNGMQREGNLAQNATHCPECGCPWFGNKNLIGEGHRVCCDCFQDWWVDIEYKHSVELRDI
jgi:uncharacterized Zn finger protein (UPF0148 family)